jgi:hypothetical protein
MDFQNLEDLKCVLKPLSYIYSNPNKILIILFLLFFPIRKWRWAAKFIMHSENSEFREKIRYPSYTNVNA